MGNSFPIVYGGSSNANAGNARPIVVCFIGQSLANRGLVAVKAGSPPSSTSQISGQMSGLPYMASILSGAFQLIGLRDEAPLTPTNATDIGLLAAGAGFYSAMGLVVGWYPCDGRPIGGATAGTNTGDYIDTYAATQPDVFIIIAGDSDIPAGLANCLTRFQTLINGILARNPFAKIIVVTAHSRGLIAYPRNPTNDAYRVDTLQLPIQLAAIYASNKNIVVVDPNLYLTDGAIDGTMAGLPKPWFQLDSIHNAPLGAEAVAKGGLVPALNKLGFYSAKDDLYPRKAARDASLNKNGNALKCLNLTGTGGLKSTQTDASSVVPDYIRILDTVGNSVIKTTVGTSTDGLPELVCEVTIGSVYSEWELQLGETTNGASELNNPFAIGDTIQGYMRVTMDAYDEWRKANFFFRPSTDGYVVEGGNVENLSGSRALESNETYAGVAADYQGKPAMMPALKGVYIYTPTYRLISNVGTIRTRIKIAVGPGRASLQAGTKVIMRLSNLTLYKLQENPLRQLNISY